MKKEELEKLLNVTIPKYGKIEIGIQDGLLKSARIEEVHKIDV